MSAVGLQSAECELEASAALRPGIIVAQIDWDGERTSVYWVPVIDVGQEDGVDIVKLDHFVTLGASGGGVFLDGVHVANIWYRQYVESNVGKQEGHITVAAIDGACGDVFDVFSND